MKLNASKESGDLTQLYVKRKSVLIAGTALLGALVVVLDVTFKMAGLKIPFPFFTDLKFDALGIPMMLAYFLFGFLSGAVTSMIAFLSITLRSGKAFDAFMKFLAEFVTILGVYVVLRSKRPFSVEKKWKIISMISGIIARVVVMDVANVLLLPIFTPYYASYLAVIPIVHFISLFNVIQGAITVFGGFLFYEAVVLRLPSLKSS
jgi:riboflavin transporter FmnP